MKKDEDEEKEEKGGGGEGGEGLGRGEIETRFSSVEGGKEGDE